MTRRAAYPGNASQLMPRPDPCAHRLAAGLAGPKRKNGTPDRRIALVSWRICRG